MNNEINNDHHDEHDDENEIDLLIPKEMICTFCDEIMQLIRNNTNNKKKKSFIIRYSKKENIIQIGSMYGERYIPCYYNPLNDLKNLDSDNECINGNDMVRLKILMETFTEIMSQLIKALKQKTTLYLHYASNNRIYIKKSASSSRHIHILK